MPSKRGLPTGISMRHDSHYVEELVRGHKTIGKIIPINQIEPNPEQPRVEIGDLTDLTSSIKEKGVLEPLLVKPVQSGSWMIIAGERRWRAANLAGLREVPCIELDIDEQSIAEIALIENLQRKDLTIWEEADGLADLAKRYNYTHDEIAKKIGKSRSTVTEAMAIAGLPKDIRERCLNAKITSKSTLLEVSRQFDEQAMSQLLDNIQGNNLKRQEIRHAARPQIKKTVEKPIERASLSNTGFRENRKTESNPNEFNPTADNVKKIFQFASDDRDFSIEIRFNKPYSKQDIINALESTLDSLSS